MPIKKKKTQKEKVLVELSLQCVKIGRRKCLKVNKIDGTEEELEDLITVAIYHVPELLNIFMNGTMFGMLMQAKKNKPKKKKTTKKKK